MLPRCMVTGVVQRAWVVVPKGVQTKLVVEVLYMAVKWFRDVALLSCAPRLKISCHPLCCLSLHLIKVDLTQGLVVSVLEPQGILETDVKGAGLLVSNNGDSGVSETISPWRNEITVVPQW